MVMSRILPKGSATQPRHIHSLGQRETLPS